MPLSNPGNYLNWYEVRFKIYEYGGGKSTDIHHKRFSTLNDAVEFKQEIELLIDPKGETGVSKHFCEDYVYDGFLVSVLGIWKCEERKVW